MACVGAGLINSGPHGARAAREEGGIQHFSFPAGSVTTTKDGNVVRKCRVADKTASIIFSLWNEQADAIEAGDILRLMKGYER